MAWSDSLGHSKMYLHSKLFKSHNCFNNNSNNINYYQLPTDITNTTTTTNTAADADLQEIRETPMQQEKRTILGRNGHIIRATEPVFNTFTLNTA